MNALPDPDAPTADVIREDVNRPRDEPALAKPSRWFEPGLKTTWILAGLLMLLGAGLRISYWAWGLSLWGDEAVLGSHAMNVAWTGLLAPMDWDQTAPVGWVALLKTMGTVFGPGELSLRAPSLIAMLLLMPVVFLLTQRVAGRGVALIALLLVVVSPHSIRYAGELKPYGFDIYLTALLAYFSVRAIERFSWGWLITLAVTGVVGVWLSHPAAFVLGGVGAGLFFVAVYQKRWAVAGVLVGISLLWIASFTAMYLSATAGAMDDGELVAFWDGGFMPLPTSPAGVRWFIDKSYEFGETMTQPIHAGLILVLYAVGAWALIRRRPAMAAIVLLPLVFALIGSAAQQYPFKSRLIRFLLPLVLIPAAVGLAELARRDSGRVRKALLIVALAVLTLAPLLDASRMLRRDFAYGVPADFFPALQYVLEHRQPGDQLYIYNGAERAFEFYTDYHLPPDALGDMPVLVGQDLRKEWPLFIEELEPMIGQGRLWMIFTHVQYHTHYYDESRYFRHTLDRRGGKEVFDARNEWTGAFLYLYDFETHTADSPEAEVETEAEPVTPAEPETEVESQPDSTPSPEDLS